MNELRKSGERIAKVIARAGLASRREAEAWIAAGRVAVNGTVIGSPALDVTSTDRVTIDGEVLPARERTRLFLYHKPRGLITTHADPQGRPTIFAKLPRDLPRLISVGRLDFNTEGLLLLTNDGALARLLELPATGWLRRYRVRAHGAVTQDQLDSLHAGVTIDGIHYGPIDAALDRVQGSNLWLTLGIREGKNREVRNVLGHFGLTVTRLIRLSFGPFQLGELAEGAIEEVRTRVLREQLGDKLVKLSGADFSAPRPAPSGKPRLNRPESVAQTEPQGARKARASSEHAWRARHEDKPVKKLRRRFHGVQRDEAKSRPRPEGQARSDTLIDRRGRPIAVERYSSLPRPEARTNQRNVRSKADRGMTDRSKPSHRARRPHRPPRQPRVKD